MSFLPKNPIFVVQRHQASHLHYDFRIEKDAVLKSWAIPKEPPRVPGIKRLAIQVADHELSYAQFEGTIPEGSYGAGTVTIWDSGTYLPIADSPGELVIDLEGKRLKGVYCLIKMKPKKSEDANWLFFKKSHVSKR
ncbi:MAG: 3'-phosphoesterase [Candidatus Omnitrophica bacterium]|nr:3'-phosphoesterase [Candidatus Omnitrophota bacterium]